MRTFQPTLKFLQTEEVTETLLKQNLVHNRAALVFGKKQMVKRGLQQDFILHFSRQQKRNKVNKLICLQQKNYLVLSKEICEFSLHQSCTSALVMHSWNCSTNTTGFTLRICIQWWGAYPKVKNCINSQKTSWMQSFISSMLQIKFYFNFNIKAS